MASDGCGCKLCAIVLFVLLSAIGFGLYYQKEIKDYFDVSPKIIFRNKTPVHAFVIKRYHRSRLFSRDEMKIYAANDLNQTELYRINWYQSENMTLTRIKDGFIAGQAQRINESSYSFKLFGQSTTTNGKMSYLKTIHPYFEIEYTHHIHKTSHIILDSCKNAMHRFTNRIDWTAQWRDITPRHSMNRGRLNIEIQGRSAYLLETFENPVDTILGSSLYQYVYDLYILKYLPDEFYLTTLIIADHRTYDECL